MSGNVPQCPNVPLGDQNVNKNAKPVVRDERGRWIQGSGSPSPGRPVSSRQKISEKLLADLAVVWEEHGASVLQRLAVTDPGKLKIAHPIAVVGNALRLSPGNPEAQSGLRFD